MGFSSYPTSHPIPLIPLIPRNNFINPVRAEWDKPSYPSDNPNIPPLSLVNPLSSQRLSRFLLSAQPPPSPTLRLAAAVSVSRPLRCRCPRSPCYRRSLPWSRYVTSPTWPATSRHFQAPLLSCPRLVASMTAASSSRSPATLTFLGSSSLLILAWTLGKIWEQPSVPGLQFSSRTTSDRSV
jgi:hypothetical protein